MSVGLLLCSSCARHVKRGECTCPFCGAKVRCADVPRVAAGRMSRAALFSASAVGVALGTADCGPVGINHYGAPFFIDEDGAAEAATQSGDATSADAADGAKTTDASAAVDAPAMAMPHYGGFMPVDGGGGSRD